MRWLIWMSCLFLLASCSSAEPNIGSMTQSPINDKDPLMTQITNPHLERSARVLATSDLSLTQEPAFVPAQTLGAQEALGLYNETWQMHVALYAFENQHQHQAAIQSLKQQLPSQGVYSSFGSNGPILFAAYAPNDGSTGDPIRAKHQVAKLATLFAGEE
ncbi:hypothetical protein SE18_14600 [Herpetosiphon geysericola]|uniref:SPOR domain-containing protein n=2 Tax=Herpetosiphon geysericola TaxID=70996 RepID=A0A0N8GRC3_9CHLR|nr:hypothetical protein SE18_14600 [Herpetosiphon geysericola]